MLVAGSLTATVAAFMLANSVQDVGTKTKGFSAIIVAYLLFCFLYHYLSNRPAKGEQTSGLDERLMAIEEASRYFGGSLNSADMFRLAVSRANEVVPFSSCVLFAADRADGRMRAVQAGGENADKLRELEIEADAGGAAGRCLMSGTVQTERISPSGDGTLPAADLEGVQSTAAIPLTRGGEAFAVLQLFSGSRTAFDGDAAELLEAIGERLAPLILSTLSFERSVSNALTDAVTDMPNERAFHMVLENQIAETQRNRDGRPLSILALDIKDFDEINSRWGHAAGDRVLGSVARSVKDTLRQMDFFARSNNDEYLAILPTADADIAEEVAGRIATNLFSSRFYINDTEAITVELNFGIAAFGTHGETAEHLLAAARTAKMQSKANAPQNVLWFPKEFVN